MVGMGTGRDVVRESHPHCENLKPVPEEKVLLSEGIVRSQAGTNRFASQKGEFSRQTHRFGDRYPLHIPSCSLGFFERLMKGILCGQYQYNS